MKINNNRNFEGVQAEGYFNANVTSTDMPCEEFNMGSCCPSYNEMAGETMPGVVCPPVYECPRETVCHRYICHEVPHIMPCNTRIINHHIYRHTYTPTYSCCEENEVQNVYERRCC